MKVSIWSMLFYVGLIVVVSMCCGWYYRGLWDKFCKTQNKRVKRIDVRV